MPTTDPPGHLRFGIFLAPFHPVGQNPTVALERDLELIEHLDRLGFDEAWIGEHHSAGYEIIASPEVFIASAAARTRTIRLGTGVSSLPYHHPFMLADRLTLLDHLTRGRLMVGVGPGALPSDAFMMGIDPARQRDMMEEALEAILALFRHDELIDRQTDWFTLRQARLQIRPYQRPHPEVAVAAQISPAGPRAAGRFGCSLLSLGATSAGGFNVLGAHWDVMEQRSEEFGNTPDRGGWRLVGPMHLADTKEQAIADVEFGLADWIDYFERVAALPLAPDTANHATLVDALNASGMAGGGRHRPDRTTAGPVGRLRQLPVDGPRMGRHGCHPPLLRAGGTVRDAEVPGHVHCADGKQGLGRREPACVHRGGWQRNRVGIRHTPSRAGIEVPWGLNRIEGPEPGTTPLTNPGRAARPRLSDGTSDRRRSCGATCRLAIGRAQPE
jgi:limonene 1,2-monooxygenase